MRNWYQWMIRMAGVLLFAGVLSAGEKGLMHCFYFTPVQTATQTEWQAFFNATDALTGKIPGLTRVWYGKLRGAAQDRQYGVCMLMEGPETLKTYAGHPAHKQWEEAYFKVRVYGTTTFDILGQ